MRRIIFLSLLLIGFAAPLTAQTRYDTDRNQGIGLTLGLASGAGISYTEILPSAFGYRGAFAVWKVGDFFFLDVGLSGLRVLSDDRGRRIYLVGSMSYWRQTDEESRLVVEEGDLVTEREFDDVDDSWSLGLGAGVEFSLSDRASFSLEAVFTYWDDSGDFLPLPQLALQYLF